jgi:phosphatidylserine/phosphatidylglycerophosphate/cardiolipin synthase-like enzyme
VKNPLLSLAPSDLRALAAAVSSGRLNPPYSASAVQRLLNASVAAEVAGSLEQLANGDTPAPALARMLDLLAEAWTVRPPLEDLIDIVVTGPDGATPTGRSTSVVVREMFQNATKSVAVVGYAVHQGQSVFQALAERMMELRHLDVRMYLNVDREPGDTSATSELLLRFAARFRKLQWPSGKRLPQIFYHPKSLELDARERRALHAKCIVVDACRVFASSANFTEAAQQRNIEIGVLFRSQAVAERILRFLAALVEKGELKPLVSDWRPSDCDTG